jgi:hypothetical protein
MIFKLLKGFCLFCCLTWKKNITHARARVARNRQADGTIKKNPYAVVAGQFHALAGRAGSEIQNAF